ncbi:MAG: BACON domain-containing protein, partial [Rikenellaceae bacterium]|nr:BACON domain-containing protein [Rikenellaceae bacterium]
INRISVPSQGDWSEIVTHELRHSFGLQHEAVADPETCQAESWDSFHPGSPCQLSPSGDYVDAQDGTLNGRYKAQLGIINPNLGSTDLTFRADNTISNRQFTLVETRTPDRAALQSLHVIDSTEPGDKEYYIDYDARVDGVRVFRIPRSNDPDTAAFPLGDQTWRPDYISLWADRDRFGLQAGECRELASGNVSVRIEQIDDQGARLSLGSGPCQGLDSLSLSFPEGTLPADGAETELTVTTSSPDLAWKLFSYDDSWLTLSPNSGVGSGQVKVTATYNSHISERRSKILLASAANPVTSTSRDSVTVIQSGRPLIDPQKVTVKGTPITGQTLSAVTKPWSPVNIRLSYQWLRQNPAGLPINIPGATAATYTVTEADAGYRLSVVVTGQIDFVPAVHQQSLWTDLAANGNCVSFLKLFMICNTTAGKISLKPV